MDENCNGGEINCNFCWKKNFYSCDCEIPDCPFFETEMNNDFDKDERQDW